jgi:hypothetical protein
MHPHLSYLWYWLNAYSLLLSYTNHSSSFQMSFFYIARLFSNLGFQTRYIHDPEAVKHSWLQVRWNHIHCPLTVGIYKSLAHLSLRFNPFLSPYKSITKPCAGKGNQITVLYTAQGNLFDGSVVICLYSAPNVGSKKGKKDGVLKYTFCMIDRFRVHMLESTFVVSPGAWPPFTQIVLLCFCRSG